MAKQYLDLEGLDILWERIKQAINDKMVNCFISVDSVEAYPTNVQIGLEQDSGNIILITLPLVTTSNAGLMSPEDKATLESLKTQVANLTSSS